MSKQNQGCSNAAKSSYKLVENIRAFVAYHGIEKCGFLTLTFPDEVDCVFEASRRFNSLRTGFLSRIMDAYIGVYERHKSGVVHFHFVLALKVNIYAEYRKGRLVEFDAEAVKKRNYRSAPKALRDLWAQMREVLPRYGFGRHHLVPVQSEKGIARYLSKYLSKGILQRKESDKGFRLVRSTSGRKAVMWRKVSGSFAWASSVEWRQALASYITEKANIARFRLRLHESAYYEKFRDELRLLSQMNAENYGQIMKSLYGSGWCYANRDKIFDDWLNSKDDCERRIYFYEMGVSGYVTVKYDLLTGDVAPIGNNYLI